MYVCVCVIACVDYLHGVYFHLVDDAFGVHLELVNHTPIGEIDQVVLPFFIPAQQPSSPQSVLAESSDVRLIEVRKVPQETARGDVVFEDFRPDRRDDVARGLVEYDRGGGAEGLLKLVRDKVHEFGRASVEVRILGHAQLAVVRVSHC